MNEIENVIFDIAEALRVPVLILALLALAAVLIELGAFIVELVRRRRRDFPRLETASVEARSALERGDELGAKAALRPVAWSTGMAKALAFMVDQWGRAQSGDRMAKGLADFDFRSLRRLERTRLLVRAGPALGLMGTLIPLSPALEGLANGNTDELSDNLRVAFSVTVLGLLIGAVAFAISLVRDRLYGQDLSDLEFVAATLAPDAGSAGAAVARPAAGARPAIPPPPPASGAAAGAKPPPPTSAKPLLADLPPPSAASGAPAASSPPSAPPAPGGGPSAPAAPAPAAPAAPVPAPPAPTPASTDPGATGAPSPSPSAGEGGAPPAPMPAGGASAEAGPPAHAPDAPTVTGDGQQAPSLDAPPPAPMPGAIAPPPNPADAASAQQSPPSAPPLPPPPIPEPSTEQLPGTAAADRPTQAQNHPPGEGNHSPARAPENQ